MFLNKVSRYLVHSGLESPGGDLVLLDDVDDGPPAGDPVAVEGVHHGLGDENIYHPLQKYLLSYLGDALKQLIRTHLWFPQGLGHSHQLFLASSSGNKVNGLRNTTCKFTDSMVKDFCFFI